MVIIGGGPGGYEAALTAARHGVETVLIEERGIGGAAVLTDVVPSKTLIATADVLDLVADSQDLGIRDADSAATPTSRTLGVDLAAVNQRVRRLADKQSSDIRDSLLEAGVTIIDGRGRLAGPHRVEVLDREGTVIDEGEGDVLLVAVGATPRELTDSPADGRRILNWTQLYTLTELPEHLIVVGSGVTGAEFASAYRALGSEVTLVSSRDQVLPGTDADAADVLEKAFARRGVTLRSRSRAAAARVEGAGTDEHVVVELTTGEEVRGSHVLMALGGIPNTAGLGLEQAGVRLKDSGHIDTDRVSRTSVRGIYAAGDCTGVFPLASVAAMQGRIAMYHALGEGVSPIRLRTVASAVFTRPEIATVGVSQAQIESGEVSARVEVFPLAGNPRAKMRSLRRGFVKLFCRKNSGMIIGGVVVAPTASELILPIAVCVSNQLTVADLASSFSVYPSLSGSITEAARQLMAHDDLD